MIGTRTVRCGWDCVCVCLLLSEQIEQMRQLKLATSCLFELSFAVFQFVVFWENFVFFGKLIM
jgi:hypothetical protein